MLSRWQTELEGKAWNSLFWKNTQAPDEEGDICFRPYEAIAYAIIAGGFYMGIIYEEKSRQFHLYNDKISYIMTCLPNGQMGQLYYGKRIRHRESFGHLLEFAHRDMAPCVYENDTTGTYQAGIPRLWNRGYAVSGLWNQKGKWKQGQFFCIQKPHHTKRKAGIAGPASRLCGAG